MVEVTKAQARGEWIAYQRKLMGLTQPQLASEIGVSTTTINRTEKGSRVLGLDELDRLAEFFGVEPDYLLNPPLPSSVAMGPWLNSEDEVAHNVHPLDAHGQVIEGPWGDGPDGGTPVQMPLPLRRAA